MLVLGTMRKQTDFYGGNQSKGARGGKWLESLAANEKAHQGPAGPCSKPQVFAPGTCWMCGHTGPPDKEDDDTLGEKQCPSPL